MSVLPAEGRMQLYGQFHLINCTTLHFKIQSLLLTVHPKAPKCFKLFEKSFETRVYAPETRGTKQVSKIKKIKNPKQKAEAKLI